MSDVSQAGATSVDDGPVAGWYQDPGGSGQLRWWDGAGWTQHLQPRPPPVIRPIVTPPLPHQAPYIPFSRQHAVNQTAPRVAYDQPENVDSIVWPLAVMPLVSVLLAWLILTFGGAIGYTAIPPTVITVACLVAATVDRRSLEAKGLAAPSALWNLLAAPLAYLIARQVTLSRQGIRSTSPVIIWVVSFVIAMVIGLVTVVPQIIGDVTPDLIPALEAQISTALSDRTTTAWVVDCPDDAVLTTPNTSFACSASDTTGMSANVTVTVDAQLRVVFAATQIVGA